MAIQLLNEKENNDTKRTYFDALMQCVPGVGGSISTLMAHFWPYDEEMQIRQKVNEICDVVNQLEATVNKSGSNLELPSRLSVVAVLIARYLCEQGDGYLMGSVDTQHIFEMFAGIKKSEIEDAFV